VPPLIRVHEASPNISNDISKLMFMNVSTSSNWGLSPSGSSAFYRVSVGTRFDENDDLLSLNLKLAGVQSLNELIDVTVQGFRKQFNFDHGSMAVTNVDQTSLSVYGFDACPEKCPELTCHGIGTELHYLSDGIVGRILACPSPLIYDLDELGREEELPHWLKKEVNGGIRNFAGVRFVRNGVVYGFAVIYFKECIPSQNRILACLGSLSVQISLIIFHIVTNEKIQRQLTEINQYREQLEVDRMPRHTEVDICPAYRGIIGDSPAIKDVFRLVSQVSDSDSTVLILGETGTGKELIARAIHDASPRKNKVMIKINCGALPANLIESELFGHERGSFTGAVDRKIGKFELANGGTLFLDEIGEMPLELQVKLLRALQEKEIDRVGGKHAIKVDVRIVAASNSDLEEGIARGRFRSDLFYRLNIFPIVLPPLRERKEDIPSLASHFIQRFAKKTGRCVTGLANFALKELMGYDWPGNIRELEHLIERCVLQADGNTIRETHLSSTKKRIGACAAMEIFAPKSIADMEREFILKTIRYCRGQIAGPGGAAEVLGVPSSTLNSRMKRLGIRKEHTF
jgi:formate hydrogenlyase transcriptional activator